MEKILGEKKYELEQDIYINFHGRKLHRIRALRDFPTVNGYGVRKGELGGYVQSEKNLSHNDYCWIFDSAKVFDDADVSGCALICGDAMVFEKATVYDMATVYDNARIFNNAKISCQSRVYGDAVVCNAAKVTGKTFLGGRSIVSGSVVISGNEADFPRIANDKYKGDK